MIETRVSSQFHQLGGALGPLDLLKKNGLARQYQPLVIEVDLTLEFNRVVLALKFLRRILESKSRLVFLQCALKCIVFDCIVALSYLEAHFPFLAQS